jgi:hypothetical protein
VELVEDESRKLTSGIASWRISRYPSVSMACEDVADVLEAVFDRTSASSGGSSHDTAPSRGLLCVLTCEFGL